MKIYISVDMEGISGVSNPEYVVQTGRLYAIGQRLMTEDANAAVRGAFDGGADEVIVADMHGASGNILAEALDPRAKLLSGAPHQPRFPFLDKSAAGLALLGYHAMAGTQGAALEHTMTSKSWHRYLVNGVAYGEIAIDAEIAAWAGVPVIMVSGDDFLCRESQRFLGDRIECAQVKLGLGRQAALCLSPEAGRERVYAAMKNAVCRLKEGASFPLAPTHAPVDVRVTYKFTPDADAAAGYGAKRIDGYTVETRYPRLCDAYGGLWAEQNGGSSEF